MRMRRLKHYSFKNMDIALKSLCQSFGFVDQEQIYTQMKGFSEMR